MVRSAKSFKAFTLLSFVSATAIGAAAATPACAQEARRNYDIPAQSLASAIIEFSRQSDVVVTAPSRLTKGKSAPAVRGSYSREQALQRLIEGSGLRSRPARNGGFVLESAPRGNVAGTSGSQTASTSGAEVSANEEIVVTGTNIRGAAPVGSPLLIVDREAIEQSYGGLQDYMETLPQAFTGISEDFSQSATSNLIRGSEIQLRGLGPGTTLTLVNGRRQAPGGATSAFVDISSIPTSAIERVEILPDGASAIYGSDAIGGVVNVKLRRDFEGAESRIRVGTAGGEGNSIQLGQLLGTRWSGGHLLAGYQYSKRDGIRFADRPYTATNGDLRTFGGSDFRRNFRGAAPGNIVNASGVVLFAIPTGQDGTALQPSDFIPGQTNYTDLSETSLLPEQEIHAAFLSASHDLASGVVLEFDGRYADRRSEFVIGAVSSATTVTVTNANPFYVSPTGGTAPLRVEYDFARDFGGPSRDLGRVKSLSAAVAARFDLPREWKLEFSGSYGREQVRQTRTNQRVTAAITAALADTNRATALNVFGDGTANNPETIARLKIDRFDHAVTNLWTGRVVADGTLFSLASGPARLALGAEILRIDYELESNFEISGSTRSERVVRSAFGELSLPVTGDDQGLLTGINLSLAGRFDDYDDVGSTFNPKIGASWQPLEAVKLRGTWGTAFRAPPFYLSNGDLRPADASASTLADPQSPTRTTRVLGIFGVSPDLKEETATVWTAGLDFMPVERLRISATYFDIRYKDKIQAGATTSALAFENQYASTGIIIRNPTAAQLQPVCALDPTVNCSETFGALIDFRIRNVARVDVAGLDYSIAYSLPSEWGEFDASVSGTYTFKYQEAITEAAPRQDVLDTYQRPLSMRLKGSLGWKLDGWNAAVTANHTGSYDDPVRQNEIGSWTSFDLSVGYDFPDRGLLSGTRVSLIATNVLDKLPPFVDVGQGYDTANASIVGRTISFQLVKQW